MCLTLYTHVITPNGLQPLFRSIKVGSYDLRHPDRHGAIDSFAFPPARQCALRSIHMLLRPTGFSRSSDLKRWEVMTCATRIVTAPLTRSRSLQPGNVPYALNTCYYAQRASAAL